jgi:hypothetical protein
VQDIPFRTVSDNSSWNTIELAVPDDVYSIELFAPISTPEFSSSEAIVMVLAIIMGVAAVRTLSRMKDSFT